MPLSGDVNRKLNASRAASGEFDMYGGVNTFNQIKQDVSGVLSGWVGAVSDRSPFKTVGVGGELSFAGVLGTFSLFKKAVSGALNFAGSVTTRSPLRRVSVGGVLYFTGKVVSVGGQVVSGLFRPLFKGSLFDKLFKG